MSPPAVLLATMELVNVSDLVLTMPPSPFGSSVAGEGAAGHRQRAAVCDGAAVAEGSVAGEGAAGHRHRALVKVVADIDAAAGHEGGVAGKGAVEHRYRQRASDMVVDAGSIPGRVAGEGAVDHRQRA